MTPPTTALIELPQSSDDDIRDIVMGELDRIVHHALFKDTTRMKRFLSYVVTEALEGREDRLKGYAIGLEVFDRADDFDPQADTIVRVQAGQLRRRLDLYYSGEGLNSEVRILIPKGRYAPVFEMRRPAIEESSPGLGAVAKIEHQNRPGIAVLTFQNLGKKEDNDYFAEGVTAEIVNALVQFRYIRIVARTASITSPSATNDFAELANKYRAQFVLTGSVRRAGDLVRISVNLLSTETGEHVYSKIFDRECTPENLFEIQEEIASYIAASVAAPFGAVNRYNRRLNYGRKSSLTSYEAFLKFYEVNLSPTTHKARELLAEFEEITNTTPRFSSAWAVISLINTFLVTQSIPSDNPEQRLETAIKAGTRASAIDPENALAFTALFQAYYHSGKFDLAKNMAAKSVALNPNDYNMLAYYAVTCAFRGDMANAIAFQDAALELIARPPMWFYSSSLICSFQNQDFEKIIGLLGDFTPDSAVSIQMIGLACLGLLEKADDAKVFVDIALKRNPNYAENIVFTLKHSYPNPELFDLLTTGWRKAGLDIPL